MASYRRKVTIDLDGTLADSVGPAMAEFRRRGGLPLGPNDVKVYDPRKLLRYLG